MITIKFNINKELYPVLSDKDGYFYIVQMDNGNIKVGISQNVVKRISTYFNTSSAGNSVEKYKIYSVHKFTLLEKVVLNKFANCIIKGAEWLGNVDFDDVVKYTEETIYKNDIKL